VLYLLAILEQRQSAACSTVWEIDVPVTRAPTLRDNDMDDYFIGAKLYGDDFSPDDIAAWFEREKLGYSGLVVSSSKAYSYEYHALNQLHGFRHLGERTFENVLGFGSFRGDELEPLAGRMKRVTIIEPSGGADGAKLGGCPVDFIAPHTDGRLPFSEGAFDLITCLGVLHHIPNVSLVVSELLRVLAPGGTMLLREPIVSMGDWRQSRSGLTLNERGIPLHLLKAAIVKGGGLILRESLCSFGPLERLFKSIRPDIHNSALLSRADAILSNTLPWPQTYHPRHLLQKFQPSSAFFLVARVTDRA
jgi:SAM-dependent methyltransferase